MKLTQKKLIELIRRKNEGWTTYQVHKITGVSIRRINQIWSQYLITEELPTLGKNNGRPSKPLIEEEIVLVKEAYLKYRVSADTLERLIERDTSKHIPHNRIHKMLIYLGYAKPKNRRDIRKKDWIRYERRHSLTAVHIDWHDDKKNWIFAVIDDASRKLLSLIECNSPTTEMSIVGMEKALENGSIKQCISDHGTQFVKPLCDGNCQFQEFLERKGIKQILCRIKHPQSNGKVEKWFNTYDNHRYAFNTKEEFLHWYNEVRPHRSLNFEALETPSQAFVRKLKAEAI